MISGPIADAEYSLIRQLVYDRSRINLGPNKKELVRSRLRARLKALGLKNFGAYCRKLTHEADGDEMTALLDAISTNVTCFFRGASQFEFLRETVLPEWEAGHGSRSSGPLRVWSAACSSGEEPYSIAIVVAEFLRERYGACTPNWEVLSTDISSRMLSTAHHAIYKRDHVRVPDPALLRTYFQKGVGPWEQHYRVKSSLREHVTFKRMNLAEWPYNCGGQFHAIFCRNVMIYFDKATQQQLIPQLVKCLLPGGYLFVGLSEKIPNNTDGMKFIRPSIYQHN